MLRLYRAAKSGTVPPPHPATSRRPPQNVPYVIDNLWEWTRPDHYLSRRGSSYASPTPEAALKAAASADKSALQVFEVITTPGTRFLQAPVLDVKDHPDCQGYGLRKTLFSLFDAARADSSSPNWASQPIGAKLAAAPLFLPVLTRDEVAALFADGGPLSAIAADARAAITFWNSLRPVDLSEPAFPFPEGEVFFPADRYQLIPLG